MQKEPLWFIQSSWLLYFLIEKGKQISKLHKDKTCQEDLKYHRLYLSGHGQLGDKPMARTKPINEHNHVQEDKHIYKNVFSIFWAGSQAFYLKVCKKFSTFSTNFKSALNSAFLTLISKLLDKKFIFWVMLALFANFEAKCAQNGPKKTKNLFLKRESE